MYFLSLLSNDKTDKKARVGTRGQASVEAAFMLPLLMLLILLLLQPGIILYDKMVMRMAAAEGCRLLVSLSSADQLDCEEYITRRLGAIPPLRYFHVHDSQCTWEIECSGSCEAMNSTVRIATKLQPLPLLVWPCAAFNLLDDEGCLLIEVEERSNNYPSWVTTPPNNTVWLGE